MTKSIIVYSSKTGFTKRYADWLAEALDGETLSIQEAKKKDVSFFAPYDVIIYGDWASCLSPMILRTVAISRPSSLICMIKPGNDSLANSGSFFRFGGRREVDHDDFRRIIEPRNPCRFSTQPPAHDHFSRAQRMDADRIFRKKSLIGRKQSIV